MRIDLHVPTRWQELSAEQLRAVVQDSFGELRREEYLLVLLCQFAGIKMVAGSTAVDDDNVQRTRFKDSEGNDFSLADWQIADFCKHLNFILDEPMPIDCQWPFRWDRYLSDTTFGNWFHADAQMLGYSMDESIERLECVTRDLGDPHDTLDVADVVLLMRWYDCFKEWIQQRYPLVFSKAETGDGVSVSPIDARQHIMLMLNDGRPQDNEAIERSNVHDVLSALQHKIEEAKHIEEQLKHRH